MLAQPPMPPSIAAPTPQRSGDSVGKRSRSAYESDSAANESIDGGSAHGRGNNVTDDGADGFAADTNNSASHKTSPPRQQHNGAGVSGQAPSLTPFLTPPMPMPNSSMPTMPRADMVQQQFTQSSPTPPPYFSYPQQMMFPPPYNAQPQYPQQYHPYMNMQIQMPMRMPLSVPMQVGMQPAMHNMNNLQSNYQQQQQMMQQQQQQQQMQQQMPQQQQQQQQQTPQRPQFHVPSAGPSATSPSSNLLSPIPKIDLTQQPSGGPTWVPTAPTTLYYLSMPLIGGVNSFGTNKPSHLVITTSDNVTSTCRSFVISVKVSNERNRRSDCLIQQCEDLFIHAESDMPIETLVHPCQTSSCTCHHSINGRVANMMVDSSKHKNTVGTINPIHTKQPMQKDGVFLTDFIRLLPSSYGSYYATFIYQVITEKQQYALLSGGAQYEIHVPVNLTVRSVDLWSVVGSGDRVNSADRNKTSLKQITCQSIQFQPAAVNGNNMPPPPPPQPQMAPTPLPPMYSMRPTGQFPPPYPPAMSGYMPQMPMPMQQPMGMSMPPQQQPMMMMNKPMMSAPNAYGQYHPMQQNMVPSPSASQPSGSGYHHSMVSAPPTNNVTPANMMSDASVSYDYAASRNLFTIPVVQAINSDGTNKPTLLQVVVAGCPKIFSIAIKMSTHKMTRTDCLIELVNALYLTPQYDMLQDRRGWLTQCEMSTCPCHTVSNPNMQTSPHPFDSTRHKNSVGTLDIYTSIPPEHPHTVPSQVYPDVTNTQLLLEQAVKDLTPQNTTPQAVTSDVPGTPREHKDRPLEETEYIILHATRTNDSYSFLYNIRAQKQIYALLQSGGIYQISVPGHPNARITRIELVCLRTFSGARKGALKYINCQQLHTVPVADSVRYRQFATISSATAQATSTNLQAKHQQKLLVQQQRMLEASQNLPQPRSKTALVSSTPPVDAVSMLISMKDEPTAVKNEPKTDSGQAQTADTQVERNGDEPNVEMNGADSVHKRNDVNQGNVNDSTSKPQAADDTSTSSSSSAQ